jgi:hypothetical protein
MTGSDRPDDTGLPSPAEDWLTDAQARADKVRKLRQAAEAAAQAALEACDRALAALHVPPARDRKAAPPPRPITTPRRRYRDEPRRD